MLIKYVLLLLVSTLLMSCAGSTVTQLERSQFVLERSLVVQTNNQNIYFQDNGVIRPSDVNQYEPFCSLNTELVSTVRSTVEIEADVFRIIEIGNDSPKGKAFTNSSGQKEGVIYQTILALESKQQPYVLSLICQRWSVGSTKRYLNFTDIEKIIGPVGKFMQ